MAGDCRDLHGIQSFLEEAARGLMPEIVESEIHEEGGIRLDPLLLSFLLVVRPGPGDSPLERPCDRLFLQSPPKPSRLSGEEKQKGSGPLHWKAGRSSFLRFLSREG